MSSSHPSKVGKTSTLVEYCISKAFELSSKRLLKSGTPPCTTQTLLRHYDDEKQVGQEKSSKEKESKVVCAAVVLAYYKTNLQTWSLEFNRVDLLRAVPLLIVTILYLPLPSSSCQLQRYYSPQSSLLCAYLQSIINQNDP